MKRSWLPLAVAFISICLTGNFIFRIFLTAIWLLIFSMITVRNDRLLVSGLLILLILCSIPLAGRHIYSGSVETIRPTYLIVRDSLSRVMVYYDGEADLDDVIVIDQDIEAISSTDNFDASTFQSWAKGNNIVGQLTLKHYQPERSGSSLRSLIYQHNRIQGRQWINELLFGNGLDVDSDYRYLIIQSGLHISFLAAFIRRLFSYFFYQDRATLLTLAVMTALAIVFRFPFAYIRTLVSLACGHFISDRRNSLAAQIIILCLIKPYYVCSLSFLIPVGLKLIRIFSRRRQDMVSRLYLTVMQLGFYGYANLLGILFFRLFASLAGWLYLAALLASGLPWAPDLSGLMLRYLKLMEKLPVLNLTGRLGFGTVTVCVFLLFRYLAGQRRLHLVMIMLILLFSMERRLLCPFYVITQIDVGQGDCCLITTPFSDHGLLIDAAGSPYRDIGEDIIIPCLYAEAVRSIDVIISHEDTDHCGSLATLQQGFRIDKVYRQKQELIVFNGLEILDPLYDRQYEDVNDNSLISYFAIDGFRFLYLGDVSWRVESDLVDRYGRLPADVLKVSHHGSLSATSEKLLACLRAKIALISAGKNNYFDHPHQQVEDRLQNFGVRIFSTKQAGAVRMIVMRRLMIIMQPTGKIALYHRGDGV
ncbi:MAG: hypothetical protein J5694_01680 [Erysipelotrichaceae bacterium]|nr:hypothetical protein [Erysipelotrichaceae bacterium]